jgi:HAD superfamily hydrolase (TIGR01484 family)
MKIIFSDFDGTLTHNDELGAVFFNILNQIAANQSELIVVSGRSLSWGHFLLTHFPLRYAIMEGGGVILHKNERGLIEEEYMVSDVELEKVEKITQGLLEKHPYAMLSKDSYGRRVDRALEYLFMDKEALYACESYLDIEGAKWSKSNVHLNYWCGEVDKFKAVEYLMNEYYSHIKLEECIFYGDSLNDESMFEKMPNSVGVSNIVTVIDELQHKPKIILEGKDNAGPHGVFNHLKDLFENSVDF